jgi:aspartate carbamoyltransferase catalytic subunit
MMSLLEVKGKLEGLKVAVVGDITHSRVARSNIHGLLTMGAEVVLCGPPNLMPVNIEELGVLVNYDIDEVLAWADAVNVLRIQRERQGVSYIPSVREYRDLFGITRERVERLKEPITIMHPGPINRGVEIDSDVADSENAIILDQVLNGVAVRMAVLYLLLGDQPEPSGGGRHYPGFSRLITAILLILQAVSGSLDQFY